MPKAIRCISLLVWILLVSIGTSFAQQPLEQLKKHVAYLSHDSLEGRMTGTPGEAIAARYIATQFKSIGLTPAGKENFHQPFEFLYRKYAGPNNTLVINDSLQIDTSQFYPLSYSTNGKMMGVAKPLGYGIEAPDLGYNDYAGNKTLSDAVLVLEISSPDGRHPHSKFIDHLDLKQRVENAISKGVAGIIFINSDPNAENPPRELSTKIQPVSIPVIFLKNPNLLKEGDKISMEVDIREDYRTGKNIVGFIDNEAQRSIIIGAHYDHLGYGKEGSLYTGQPAIHNGADDNASGVAVMIELARWLKDNDNFKNHNFLFIAFSGEELGLYGSNYFANRPQFNPAAVNYMINLDMVGRLDSLGRLAINGVGTSPAFSAAVDKVSVKGIQVSTTLSGIGPSDHTSFYLKDIPVVHFFTGVHEDYHKPSDDAHKVNYEGMVKVYTFIQQFMSALREASPLTFTPTKADNPSQKAPKFSVTLGVVPDYMYQGEGMRIQGVREDRPADKAGIQDGDIVIQMGDLEITDMMSYMKGLSQFKKGDKARVKVLRDGKEKVFEVTF